MRYYFFILIKLLSIVLLVSKPVVAKPDKPMMIAGWLELVVLAPWQIQLKAKLDTGAKTSSIHAEEIERFKRDGTEWVKFALPKGKRKKSVERVIEAPVVRNVAIKRHNLPPVIRPVVELEFCINDRYYQAEFTLADRGNFNYPVLLGRRFLKNNVMVDASEAFLHGKRYTKKRCEKPVINNPNNESSS